MSWALTWCLVAAAILLGGPGRARAARVRKVGVGTTMSPRVMGTLGAACVSVGAVAVGGFVTGAVVAAVLAPPVAVALGRIAARPARAGPQASLAFALDLAAVALRSGQPVASALELAAPALGGPAAREWRRVAGLLALGSDPDRAWAAMADDPLLAPVGVSARRSAHSGARLAGAFTQLAVETRATLQAAAVSRANRAGVLAMAPLGLCFLPAFVCLGIVPTVAGIAGDVLAGVP
ncbi:MAG: type II secretion system F family protein [Jatrophihabitantaceae bacterium]